MLLYRYLGAFALAAPLAAIGAIGAIGATDVTTCLVVRIADGDTLTARCGAPGGYQQVKIRLAEIDAPEKAQPFGERSRQSLAAMCAGEQAVLRPTSTDRYGRSVARVKYRGKDANAEQVRAGMAWAYTQYQSDPIIPRLERQARAARVGLWVAEGTAAPPVLPLEWRAARRARTKHEIYDGYARPCLAPP